MNERPAADTAWWQINKRAPTSPYRDTVRTSRYLEMRDGVRIAIDLYLPKGLSPATKVPAILHQTRYYRRINLNWPFGPLIARRDPMLRMFRRFVSHGYALVNVDVRGTGASFGSRQMEWSPDEVKDAAEIAGWIIGQPWSDGQVATWGISYTGTAAEKALINHHPAIRAAVIQYALFDIYPDIVCPGGARNDLFLRTWSALNAAMDKNDLRSFARHQMSALAGLAVGGVAPVDGDETGALLREAVNAHDGNYGIYTASLEAEFADDRTNSGLSADDFSPHAFLREIASSGAAIYSWSGWYDGAWTLAAIIRFLNMPSPGTRLILGPWDHGGEQNPDPFVKDHVTRFDHGGEVLRFLDYHLKGIRTGIETEPPVHYFTVGEEAWKAAETWPPAGFTLASPRAEEGADRYRMDYAAGSGRGSRWLSQVNVRGTRIGYPDRKGRDARLLAYTSSPLEGNVEVTGNPLITLFIRSNAPDAQLFAYLEDVWPNGDVFYVTEGVFRALHRKISQETPYRTTVPYHSFKWPRSRFISSRSRTCSGKGMPSGWRLPARIETTSRSSRPHRRRSRCCAARPILRASPCRSGGGSRDPACRSSVAVKVVPFRPMLSLGPTTIPTTPSRSASYRNVA
jgi:putative CocE/NonD family hydrolase